MSTANDPGIINLTDAAALYGVSTSTIHCFIETGYLRVTGEKADEKFISRRDLAAVFGAPLHDAAGTQHVPEELQSGIVDAHIETAAPPKQEVIAPVSNESVVTLTSVVEPSKLNSEIEVMKLKNIITVQEQLLKMREDQIADLRNDRDWLKSRVERMEQTSQREQLLLLAESETVRKLVAAHSRSPIRAALEWLGFSEPEKGDRGTITVNESARH